MADPSRLKKEAIVAILTHFWERYVNGEVPFEFRAVRLGNGIVDATYISTHADEEERTSEPDDTSLPNLSEMGNSADAPQSSRSAQKRPLSEEDMGSDDESPDPDPDHSNGEDPDLTASQLHDVERRAVNAAPNFGPLHIHHKAFLSKLSSDKMFREVVAGHLDVQVCWTVIISLHDTDCL